MRTIQSLNFSKLFLILIIASAALFNEVAAGKPAPSELSTKTYNAPIGDSRFDNDLICIEIVRKSMLKCWEMTKGGMLDAEAGFSLLKEGSAYAVLFSQSDNLYRKDRLIVTEACVAIFHVHPRSVPPEPSHQDKQAARKINKPVCTITDKGIYCFFPDSNKTIKLKDFPEWIKPCNKA